MTTADFKVGDRVIFPLGWKREDGTQARVKATVKSIGPNRITIVDDEFQMRRMVKPENLIKMSKEGTVKVGIFYMSLRPGFDRQPIMAGNQQVWIRVEVVEQESLADALDLATPRSDENVMNTHELE